MKKITLAIAAIIMGFVMASCGTKVAPTETILKATQEFFDQAKTKLSSIQSAEDFLAFVNNFNKERDDFSQNLFADYMDEEGNGFCTCGAYKYHVYEDRIDELKAAYSDYLSSHKDFEVPTSALIAIIALGCAVFAFVLGFFISRISILRRGGGQ